MLRAILLAVTIYAGPMVNLYQGPTVTFHGSERRGTGENPRGQYGQVLSYLGQKNFDALSNASLEKLRKTKWTPFIQTSNVAGYYEPMGGIGIAQGKGRERTNFYAMHEALHRLDPYWDVPLTGREEYAGQVLTALESVPGIKFDPDASAFEYFPNISGAVNYDPMLTYRAAGPAYSRYYRGVFR